MAEILHIYFLLWSRQNTSRICGSVFRWTRSCFVITKGVFVSSSTLDENSGRFASEEEAQNVVGDWVYLKLKHPYRQHSMARRQNEKLARTSRIHDVFHVSQLRKVIRNRAATPQLRYGSLLQPRQLERGVMRPMDKRFWFVGWIFRSMRHDIGGVQGYKSSIFDLKGKVHVSEGSIDTSGSPGRFGWVYQRRKE